jgi:hypothetical protein
MMLRVFTEVGDDDPVELLAKVVSNVAGVYTIRYLSPTEDRVNGKVLHRYEDDEYEVTDESVTEYYSGDEDVVGFRTVGDGFLKEDSDSDYESEPESESESESVVDSENFSEDINESD